MLVLLAHLQLATLNFDGTSSSIVFDNSARLTATCSDAPPSISFSPAVTKIYPRSFAPAFAGAEVTVRMTGVPLSCANATDYEPCALAFDPAEEPAWFCAWQNELSSEVVGPLAATVWSPHAVNSTFLHAAYTSPCATSCELLPANVVPLLKCPLPSNLTGLLAGGVGSLELAVSYFAPAGQADSVAIPFVGRGKVVSVSLSPPSPPPLSPPSPPPAPPPPEIPPPAAPLGSSPSPPWYKVTSGATASSGADRYIRMFPIYMGGYTRATWDFAAYRDACSAAGFRVWYDSNPHGCVGRLDSNPPPCSHEACCSRG